MKDNIFALELSFDNAPEGICKQASEKTQHSRKLHKKLTAKNNPYFILRTCRRITVFAASSCSGRLFDSLGYFGIEKKYLQIFKGEDAVRHLLLIASGLKSPNIGENEILHQFKNVLKESDHLKILDVTLRKLLQKAIETGRRVRSETAILKNNLSYPAIVHKMLMEKNIPVENQKILILGNGQLGNSCIKYFINKKAKITLATKNPQKVSGWDNSINVISREDLIKELLSFKVVIGATSSNEPIIMKEQAYNFDKSTVFIDLAMPSNFDPDINKIRPGVLYNLAYIFSKAHTIKEEKSVAILEASKIIEEETDSYIHWLKARKAVKIIRTLKEELEVIKLEEHNRIIDDFGEMDLHQKRIISNLVNRITSRIAHTHYSQIKEFVVNEQS